MGYKRHDWMAFGNSGNEIIEITIRDSSGRKLDFFRCNNKRDFPRILQIINMNYGWDIKVHVEKVGKDGIPL